MLTGNFFDIQSFTCTRNEEAQQNYAVVVSLIEGHPIYQGHFPGNPVVPGVCQVQMVKELVEKAVRVPVKLTESDNIKFLSMINPLVNPQLDFNIVVKPAGVQQFSVTASIGSGELVFLKFKGKFESAG
jgi:3-hydroxyacyl-[acyl-carrier-protein] dehydratase